MRRRTNQIAVTLLAFLALASGGCVTTTTTSSGTPPVGAGQLLDGSPVA